MSIGSTIKKSLYWGGVLGSIFALVYAIFIWKFQWVIQVSGTVYLDAKPIVIQNPPDTKYKKFKDIKDFISKPHSIVAKNQTLFTVQAQILPNLTALDSFYNKNQHILYTALLNNTNALFLPPSNAYEQRIYDIFTTAYKQDISNIQTRQYQIQQYIDDLQQKIPSKIPAAATTKVHPPPIQTQIDQLIQMQDNIHKDLVAYLKQNAPQIKQKLFSGIIVQPMSENIAIKSPINGYLVYSDTPPSQSTAHIYPIDAPVVAKVYVPADIFPPNKPLPQVEILYIQGTNTAPIRMPATVYKIIPTNTDTKGNIAVIVRLQDPYIYKNKHFMPQSPVHVSIPYATGTPYQYAKQVLKLPFKY